MKHNLHISVSKEPDTDSIASCRKVTIRERLLRFCLGEKRKMFVLIPGDNVGEISIGKMEKGEEDHHAEEKYENGGPSFEDGE